MKKLGLVSIVLFITSVLFGQYNLELVNNYELNSREIPSDLVIYGDYAYVANGKDGMHVLHISDLNSIEKVDTYIEYEVRSRKDIYGTAEKVYLFQDKLYLAYGDLGFKLFGLSDPAKPELLGDYYQFKFVHSILPEDNFTILGLSNGITIIDHTNNQKMEMLSILNFKDYSVKSIQRMGNHVFLTGGDKGLNINEYNTSNYKFWTKSSTYDTHGITDKIILEDKVMYVANGAFGLQILDVKLMRYPSVIANLPTKNKLTDIVKEGNKIYAAAENTLYIFNVEDIQNPILEYEQENKGIDYIDVLVDNGKLFVTYKGKKDFSGIEIYTIK